MGIHRLALATTDKLTIHQHFGHAEGYEITDVDTDKKSFEFVEYRKTEPPCKAGGHSDEVFDAVLEVLSDCEAIVVGKIGPGAADYVLKKGMRIFEAPSVIEKIIGTLIEKNMLA